jgi:HSP20 family protein
MRPGGNVNKLAVQRQSRPKLPELSELSHLVTGLPAFAGLRPFFENNLMKLEDESKEGVYEVRAELPGIDPIEDLEVTVLDGELTIKALRTRTSDANGTSEFAYGAFTRTVVLPDGADEDDIHATYDRGILTVSIPLSDTESVQKHVEVYETTVLDDDEDDDYLDDELDDDDADEESGDDEPEAADQPEAEDQHQPDDGN